MPVGGLLYKSCSTLGLLGARGVTSGTPPACCQGPAADHPGTRTKKLVGLQPSGDGCHAIQYSPVLQTRFRWRGGMMSCRLCLSRVACEKEAGGPAGGLFQPSRFKQSTWHVGQTLCTKQCVSKSSRPLDAVSSAVRWRRAKNSLRYSSTRYSSNGGKNSDGRRRLTS